MGKPAVPLRYKLIPLCVAGLIACGFLPLASAFAEGNVSTPMLASSLLDGSTAIVSEDVKLTSIDDEADTAIEPVIGSFTVDGLTFAVADDSVMLVSVDPSVILSGASAAGGVEGSLSIPPSITYTGVTYLVTAIGPYAFYLSGATQVELPASIASVDDRAFRSSDVERVEVASDNPDIASFDGCLYDSQLTSLLLIPEGRAGAVLLPCETEVAEPSKFSHCSLVDAISVEEGGAAFASWDGLLYNSDGTTLLRVPAGAVNITIREGCTTIAAGAMEGCAKLERINAPASVTSISPNVFESVPTVSLPASILTTGEAPTQIATVVALTSIDDQLLQAHPGSIDLLLPQTGSLSPWNALGFSVKSQNDDAFGGDSLDAEGMPHAFLSTGSLYAATGVTVVNKTSSPIWRWGIADQAWATSIQPGESYYHANANYARFYNGYFWTTTTAAATAGSRYGINKGAGVEAVECITATTDYFLTPSATCETIASGATYYIYDTSAFTVTFDKKGGSGGTSSVTIPPGGKSVGTITKPTLSGWTFQGYTDDMGTNTYLYVNSSGVGTSRTITSDKTLLANWTKTVSFSANGGTAGSLTSMTAGIGRVLGQKCSQVGSTNSDYPIRVLFNKGITDSSDWAPTRAGYTFAGFYNTSASTGGTCYVNASGVAQSACNPVTSSMPSTLYARWTPNTYAVSFNANGGSGGQSANVTATYGSAMPTISATKPTRAGYAFEGYYDTDAETGGTQYYTAGCASARTWNKTAAATLYARWSPVVAAMVPLEVTARIDRLGVEEQHDASGYIESRSGGALDVTDVEFEPLAGAASLFGADVGSVSLEGFPDTSTTPLFAFSLDSAGVESDAGALSPLTMESYGARIPIRYRFDIPDGLLPTLTETTLPVCQVSYTVALVE